MPWNQLNLIKTSFIAYIRSNLALISILCATILTDQIGYLEVEEWQRLAEMHHQLYWQSWLRPDDLLALLNLLFSPLYAHCPPAEICNTAGQFWPSWLICLDTILAHKINWKNLSSIFCVSEREFSELVQIKHSSMLCMVGRINQYPFKCLQQFLWSTDRMFMIGEEPFLSGAGLLTAGWLPSHWPRYPPRRTDGPNGHGRPTNHRHLTCGRSRRRRLELTSLLSDKRQKRFRCLLGKLNFKVVLVFRDGGRCSALNC